MRDVLHARFGVTGAPPRRILWLSGLPASGKTTYARGLMRDDARWKRVNKDALRGMLHEGPFDRTQEDVTTAVEDAVLRLLLPQWNVIVDDTNLDPKHWARVCHVAQAIAESAGLSITVQERHFPVPLAEALRRNGVRPAMDRIPDAAIENLHQRYLAEP